MKPSADSSADGCSQSTEGSLCALSGKDLSRRTFQAFHIPFTVQSSCAEAAQALSFQYRHLLCANQDLGKEEGLKVEIQRVAEQEPLFSTRINGEKVFRTTGLGHLLHELDNELCRHFQCAVPQLYFIHAACVAKGSSATLIVGESGAGKSTTAYALCSSGLSYLSDELAAVDLVNYRVLPYPRAICLKTAPPPPLRLPAEHLRTEWTLHVSPDKVGAAVMPEFAHLERIVFLIEARDLEKASIRRLSSSEAAMCLYQGALNQLAHPSWGLDDTLRLAGHAQCYELRRGGIEDTLEALKRMDVL